MTTVEPDGGDRACWLDRVCDVCGLLLEDGREHDCRQPVTPPPTRPVEA